MPVVTFKGTIPKIGKNVFIAPDAWVTGAVTVEDDVSIFFGSCLRGDLEKISVGKGTNIQELSVLHTSGGAPDCIVGQYVTVGHRAILHSCKVGNNCIVGMGATILDGAEIGENCIVGAQSLVTMGEKIPPGMLALGVPARVVRPLSEKELKTIKESAEHYIATGREYRTSLK